MKLTKSLLICLSFALIFAITSCSKTTNNGPTYLLVSPANNSANIPANQVFTCTNPGNVALYKFQFTDNTVGNTAYIIVATNSTTAANLTAYYGNPTSLVSGHIYSWNVAYQLTDGSSVNSPTWSFTAQ